MRVSNQFVGPLYRLRRNMRELAAGESVRPIKFRDGDFGHEFADEFNELARKMQALREGGPDASTSAMDESAEPVAAAT